jgi:nucleotide-binding universal stress UspA family protein
MAALEWKKILCPVDFSVASRETLEVAAALSFRFGAELTLFHAYPLPGYTLPEGTVLPRPQMLQELADQTDRHLAEWKDLARSLGVPAVETAKSVGEPAAEIVEFAQQGDYDLIVMSTHGRTGIAHALLGSVAERVVRRSLVPVLTIRPGA